MLTLSPAPAAAALPNVRILPAAVAVDIAQHALAACTARGFRVAVVIADPAGAERVLIAGDGVKAIDIESARRKALTAAVLAAKTLDIAKAAAAAPGGDKDQACGQAGLDALRGQLN